MLWLPEGKQANRAFSWLPVPISQAHSQPESPASFLTTPMASLFKRQKEKDQKLQNGLEPKGPTLTPLQATPSRLLGKRGEARPRAHPHLWQCPEAPVFSITAKAFHPSPANPAGEGATTSVLIDSKDPDSVELGELGNEHSHQGHSVEYEMDLVILGVEAGEEVQHYRRDG